MSRRNFDDADVRRYAAFITGHPDAAVDDQHLQAVRAVLEGLDLDGRLLSRAAARPARRRVGPNPLVALAPPQCRWDAFCHRPPVVKVQHSKLGEIEACAEHAEEHADWLRRKADRDRKRLMNIHTLTPDDEPDPYCACPDEPRRRAPYCALHGTRAERGIDTSMVPIEELIKNG